MLIAAGPDYASDGSLYDTPLSPVLPVAPTGTIAIIAGCSSGLEPLFAVAFMRNQAGVMVNAVDTHVQLYDASAPYRDRAMRGVLHSGTVQKDQRSVERTGL